MPNHADAQHLRSSSADTGLPFTRREASATASSGGPVQSGDHDWPDDLFDGIRLRGDDMLPDWLPLPRRAA